MQKRLEKTQNLTVTAILAAIVILISFLPLKTLGLEINFAMVPVGIGAIVFGPATGLILGAVFGAVSFLQCFGYSAFGALLLSENPIFTFLVCIPTRMLAGYLTGLIFWALKRSSKINLGIFISSIAAPFLNTAFFMSMLVALFYKSETVQNFVKQLGAANPFMFIILFVGINGLVEIIAGFIVTLPCSKALKRYLKK